MQKSTIKKILPYLWLLAPAITLALAAQTAYRSSLNAEEYPYACDQFGYLRMAKQTREAISQRRPAQFKLESPQTRELIEFMKSRRVPLPRWEEVVAPHAHHYFPVTDSVAVQYPPGTGLTLAMFPEGYAVHNLNRLIVVVLTVAGALAILLAAWKRAWFSAVLAVLGVEVGLTILARVGTVSFSINASLVPLLLAVLLAFFSIWLRSTQRLNAAWIVAVAAGCALGYAVLVRVTTVLFIPAFLVLLWPSSRRLNVKNLLLPLALGVIVVGLVPVLWHQQQISGAWYLPTYGRIDATTPTVSRIEHHLSYYFGDGFAAKDNWALVGAIVGFAGFVLLLRTSRNKVGNASGITWHRLALVALAVWLLPTVFFLSHAVHGLHYSMPTTFVTVALIGFGSLFIEITSKKQFDGSRKITMPALIGVTLVAVSAFGALAHAYQERTATPSPDQPIVHTEAPLPLELSDPRAWIWADLLTGTLWYYHQKPAFKISFTDRQTRALIFKFAFDRGEPQYLLRDSDTMELFMTEISTLGGTLEPKGTVNGQPYFLIHWPKDGPATG